MATRTCTVEDEVEGEWMLALTHDHATRLEAEEAHNTASSYGQNSVEGCSCCIRIQYIRCAHCSHFMYMYL